jgi:hypothetical protein
VACAQAEAAASATRAMRCCRWCAGSANVGLIRMRVAVREVCGLARFPANLF